MASLRLLPNHYQESLTVFKTNQAALQALLVDFRVQIEHVGSTALPSALTKPVLDILMVAETADKQKEIAFLLTHHGYQPGELDRKQTKLFFSKSWPDSPFVEAIHLHLAYLDTPNPTDLISLKVRDYLLTRPSEIELYNQEKLRLAEAGHYDRHFYVTHKEPYLRQLVEKVIKSELNASI
jgi:GrpB-like predicted nucleotidyltransferase (UPF0157 family)